jgi:hypothetical protein
MFYQRKFTLGGFWTVWMVRYVPVTTVILTLYPCGPV